MIVNAEAATLISRSLAASAFALGFGEPVYRAAANGGDTQCSADAAAGLFLGVSRRTGVLDPANTPVDTFATNDEVPIMMDGVIGVAGFQVPCSRVPPPTSTPRTRSGLRAAVAATSSRLPIANSTAPPPAPGWPSCA
jgi:hypothetical protein